MNPLIFEKEYVLENEVARLRPLRSTDFDLLAGFAINEPTLWRYSLTPANSVENMKSYLNAVFEDRLHKKSYPFIVFDKRLNRYAGSTRFYDYNEAHHTTQLGYTWYGKDFWGTGLNKNCKYLMLEFAFEVLALERVEFRADSNNIRSIAAMKSIGCKEEGILRKNCIGLSGRRDSIVLSILKDEWFDTVKISLQEKCKKI